MRGPREKEREFVVLWAKTGKIQKKDGQGKKETKKKKGKLHVEGRKRGLTMVLAFYLPYSQLRGLICHIMPALIKI